MTNKSCYGCGKELHITANVCPNCGAIQNGSKNKFVAVLLAFFFGGFGIHKFYLGKTIAGILYLVFFWTFIPCILSLIDLIIIAFMSEKDFVEKYS